METVSTGSRFAPLIVFFLIGALTFFLPLGLLFKKFRKPAFSEMPPRKALVSERIHVRVLSIAWIATLLMVLVLSVLPFVTLLSVDGSGRPPAESAASLFLIAFSLIGGLLLILYAIRRNDLSWLKTFRKQDIRKESEV